MKYKVLTPMARIGQAFAVGDLIEITDKAEAERMITAGIVAPIAGARQILAEIADLEPVGVETTSQKSAVVKIPKAVKTAKIVRKRG